MKRNEIIDQVNNLLDIRLFYGLKRILYEIRKKTFINTNDYKNAVDSIKKEKLKTFKDSYFKDSEKFYLKFHSIFSVYPLFKREQQIRAFDKEDILRIKADYVVNGIEFSAQYPTAYRVDMQKEVEDCIADLKSKKFAHKVDSYIPRKDFEKSPNPPLTNADVKYSAFYLYNLNEEEVTKYLKYLHEAKLITDYNTDGWNIPDEYSEEMITILNQVYKEEEVLQYKRKFNDNNNDREKIAIIPINISFDYFPKNIENTEEFSNIDFETKQDYINCKKLYEFIFYMTLATQMNNSIYDKSRLEIVVGNRTLTQEANVLIEGQDNWEKLTGSIINKLQEFNDGNNKPIIIPELKSGDELRYTDIYAYKIHTKRPPRYGRGRFGKQILEKYKIGKYEEQDEIIKNLIDSKAVIQIKKILYPQEQTYFCIEWIEKYIPQFTDIEYLHEFEEKISLVERNQITLESLINEINLLISNGFEKYGYIEDNNSPTDKKIKLLNAIAKKYNLKLNPNIYKSNAQIELILAKYPVDEPKQIGTCPKCNALVYQREYIDNNGNSHFYYMCEKFSKSGNGCNFSIWDKKIYSFFSKRRFETYKIEEREELLRRILSKKKGYFFDKFIKADGQKYAGNVVLKEYENHLKNKKLEWRLDFEFPKRKRK